MKKLTLKNKILLSLFFIPSNILITFLICITFLNTKLLIEWKWWVNYAIIISVLISLIGVIFVIKRFHKFKEYMSDNARYSYYYRFFSFLYPLIYIWKTDDEFVKEHNENLNN